MNETIQEVKTRHQDQLMATPGVVSVGIGKDAQGKPAIIVGVESEAATTKLPASLNGYPVVIQTTGPIKAQ